MDCRSGNGDPEAVTIKARTSGMMISNPNRVLRQFWDDHGSVLVRDHTFNMTALVTQKQLLGFNYVHIHLTITNMMIHNLRNIVMATEG